MASGRIISESPEFVKIFKKLAGGKYMLWTVWNDFVLITACAISNSVDRTTLHWERREKMYLDCIGKYEPEEAKLFQHLYGELVMALDKNPRQDFLGEIFMQLGLGSRWAGQFFTPYHLCEAMGSVSSPDVLEQIEEQGVVTVQDPACGAGATLIGFLNSVQEKIHEAKKSINWQNHILFTAQDIDSCVGMMCYIQLSLLGCAGYVKIGDSLEKPMKEGESDESYWYTPMYFSTVWELRRVWKSMDAHARNKKSNAGEASMAEEATEEEATETEEEATTVEQEVQAKEEPVYILNKQGQLSLF